MNYLVKPNSTPSIRILGIDPGLRYTGWAIIDTIANDVSYVASGVIKVDPKKLFSERLIDIFNGISKIIGEFSPQIAGLEETYVNKNFKSSLSLAHARAAAIVSIGLKGIKVCEYSPKTIKKTITGNGNADKISIQSMLNIMISNLKINSDDESDAIAIAICHALHYR